MCHCVQTVRNLVRGRGKFNVYEEIISLQFTVHDTSHHICKQCLRKLQKRRGLRTRQAFRRKPAKETPRVVAYEKADCIFYSLQVAVSVRLVFVRNETTYTLLEESLMIWPHTYLMCVLVSGLLYLR